VGIELEKAISGIKELNMGSAELMGGSCGYISRITMCKRRICGMLLIW